ISLALISPLGPTFYGVCDLPTPIDPWVANHVVPQLWSYGMPNVEMRFKSSGPYTLIRACAQQFIAQYKNPLIICDWNADAVHFLKMLEGENFGSSLDFECQIQVLK